MKTKTRISISLNKELLEIIEDNFRNKSKYVEHLIYKDLLINSENIRIKKIIL